jgi:response regulator RpfG family c-di-GMP phosphodiesterase
MTKSLNISAIFSFSALQLYHVSSNPTSASSVKSNEEGAKQKLNNADTRNVLLPNSLTWEDSLHTPYFRVLVQSLLEIYWRYGVLNDIPYEDIPLIAEIACQHDIGKRDLPDSIVYKASPLTQTEAAVMQLHTVLGAYVVVRAYRGQLNTPEAVYFYEICRHHHERWDGSGYPDHLQGDQIPRYVQIVSVADAYDALVASRSYRKGFSHEDAAKLIPSGFCGVFSPEIMEPFQEYIGNIHQRVYTTEDCHAE